MNAQELFAIPHTVRSFCGDRLLIGLKLGLIAAFVLVTNFGFLDRVTLLVVNERWGTLVPYLGVWGLAIAALLAAAFQPRPMVRCFWALLIALSSAFAYGYYSATNSDLSVHDLLSLWSARHEAGRAAEFYNNHLVGALLILSFGAVAMILPATLPSIALRKWTSRLALLPLVPVFAISGIVYAKGGGGSQALPKQFTPIALSFLVAEKVATQGVTQRKTVTWQPVNSGVPNIIMMVDESVRADFVDLTPSNNTTPKLAALAHKFVDFGPAVSGGNCSHYSNAILRFAANRRDLVTSIGTNPTLWQFAKKAGYRTVFIDTQAGVNKNPGLLQNFMSPRKKPTSMAFMPLRIPIQPMPTAA